MSKLLDKFNAAVKGHGDSNQAMSIGTAMNIRADEITEKQVLSILTDKKYEDITKITAIQIFFKSQTPLKEEEPFKKILLDNSTIDEIKHNLLWLLAEKTDCEELLEYLSLGNDGDLAFQALKALNIYYPEAVIPISDEILSSYQNGDTEKLRAAIKFKALQMANADDRSKQPFIDFCLRLFDESKDELLKETIVFAFSDIRDIRAIRAIVESDEISIPNKAFCIYENRSILLDLAKNPTPDDIQFLEKAMSIHRIDEVIDAAAEFAIE